MKHATCESCGETLRKRSRWPHDDHCDACLLDIARMIGDGLAGMVHPTPKAPDQ